MDVHTKRAKWVAEMRAAADRAAIILEKDEPTEEELTEVERSTNNYCANVAMRSTALESLVSFYCYGPPKDPSRAIKLIHTLSFYIDDIHVDSDPEVRTTGFTIGDRRYAFDWEYNDLEMYLYPACDIDAKSIPAHLLEVASVPFDEYSRVIATVLLEALISGWMGCRSSVIRGDDFPTTLEGFSA